MSQRTRAGKTTNARASSSKVANTIRKLPRSTIPKKTPVKKSPSNKRSSLEQTPSPTRTRRQKRLSGLTAATLLQYCTNILSPSSNEKLGKTGNKRTLRSTTTSPTAKKTRRNSSKQSIQVDVSTVVPTRTRREASSRASAMIMQQNEIERSRFNYTVSQPSSSSNNHRRAARVKSPSNKKEEKLPVTEPFQFNIPPVPPTPSAVVAAPAPSITTVSNQTEYAQSSNAITCKTNNLSILSGQLTNGSKYPILTEALLAEHDRLNGTIPSYHTTKRDNLIKWTQGLTRYDCTSPPSLDTENSGQETSSVVPIPIVNALNSSVSTGNLNSLSRSLSFSFGQGATTPTNHPVPTFLPPSTAYPIGLRSFYPLLPCWQYPAWPFHPSTSLVNPIPISTLSSITAIPKKTSLSKVKTSHSKLVPPSTVSLESTKQEPLTFHLHTHHHHHHIHNSNGTSAIDPTVEVAPVEPVLIPLDQSKLTNGIQEHDELVRKTTRRKPSPIEKRVRTRSQVHRSPSTSPTVIKRSLRGPRTRSSPIVSRGRSVSSSERKRAHSSTSVQFPLLTKTSPKRKKQKVSHYWTLFGKFERTLVSIHADQAPVYRKCYPSIRHITDKEIIRSGDCVLLRPDSGHRHGVIPYLAKVKWFWEEPITGEIQMSLIWYYHPEHTELSARVKETLLPNELVASKYSDCINVACIEDKCYVLNLNEYNRYCLREKSKELFDHSEPIGKLKSLLNRNTSHVHHRPLPGRSVDEQNIFFCRYVYDYRAKRLIKNPSLTSLETNSIPSNL